MNEKWTHKTARFLLVKLELRQYKNGLASVKSMFVLKLPPFFPHLHDKGKGAAISKLACVSQKRTSSYIVLALGQHKALRVRARARAKTI